MKSKYVYKFLDGTKVTINSEEVGEEMIEILRKLDDKERNPSRRDSYHNLQYLDSYDDVEEHGADCNPYLTDGDADPLKILLREIDEEANRERIEKLRRALADLTTEQQRLIDKKFFQDKPMSNTDIAEEEGVHERTIRRRLKAIYEILEKKISK